MSTILRGSTSLDYHSILTTSGLNIDIRAPKENKITFVIDVTDKDFQDFHGQITDTINFLKTHHIQLNTLKSRLPDLSWEIDYGYNSKVATGELAVEGLLLPLELLKLCTELQIEILVSLYDGKLFE